MQAKFQTGTCVMNQSVKQSNNVELNLPAQSVENLFQKISVIIEESRGYVATAVKLAEVYSKYQIGKYIIEEEQQGQQRAQYGKQVLKELSSRLTETYGDGWSVPNLKAIRQFYSVYSDSLNTVNPIQDEQKDSELVHYSERLNTAHLGTKTEAKTNIDILCTYRKEGKMT